MNVVVVGAGAVGCLVGGQLAAAGEAVTLVGRDWLVEALRDGGLRINVRGEARYVAGIDAVTTVAEAFFEFGPFDLVLFTMKAYDMAEAISQLRRATKGEPPPVLSLQNGIGNEQQLIDAFGADRVMAGSITMSATIPLPGVVHGGRGGMGLAAISLGTPIESVAEVFRRAGFDTRIYDDWQALKWSKLLLNIIGNATAAILAWSPERIFASSRLFDLEWRAWHEALAVIRAAGIRPVSLPGYPLPWAIRLMHWMPRSLVRPILQRTVGRGRGSKMPSLYMDLERGKSQSEVTVLNGAVAAAGRRLGVPTPVNATLTHLLSGIVRGEIDWEAFRGRPARLLALIDEMPSEEKREMMRS